SLVELIVSVGTLSIAGAFILLFFSYSKDINIKSSDLDKSVYFSNYIVESTKAELWKAEPLKGMNIVDESSYPEDIIMEFYYDEDWEETDYANDDLSFVIKLRLDNIAEEIEDKSLYDLTIDVIRKKPYFRAKNSDGVIYTLKTKAYLSLKEGDFYD
ncbi:MAG: hypothetical protein KGZ96_11090, partial [Clostridia bacterium]|nr:hypothetical protein [Clostridia bacterium]